MTARPPETIAPPAPPLQFSIGVTGHRETHHHFTSNRGRIETALNRLFDHIDKAVAAEAARHRPGAFAPNRLQCLLADGTDQMAAASALARGWELVAPLPFGHDLNVAINSHPAGEADARALLSGNDAADPEVQARAQAIRAAAGAAHRFELAERDELIAGLHLARLAAPADMERAQAFHSRVSERVALAARIMIEQSDILIGVWDGESLAFVGGTGHTISAALEVGAPAIWVDAERPEDWRILHAPESLANPRAAPLRDGADIEALVRTALRPAGGDPESRDDLAAAEALASEVWRPRSSRWWSGYRRVEAMFGGGGRPFRSLHQRYEHPDRIADGSAAGIVTAAHALPGGDPAFVERVRADVLRRFAWADGVSAYLSDIYRGGMIASFILSACAVVAGIVYQPTTGPDRKWLFASLEFLLLATILLITWRGQRKRWHGRWFETRRVAEYFRHAPILLLLGAARPPGRWPKGADTSWPEWYVRNGLRSLGLPRVSVTSAYLAGALRLLLDEHVVRQRDYHQAKAKRLTTAHHNLDRLSERMFQLAVVSVATFLVLMLGVRLGMVSREWLHDASRYFTLLGVLLPTFGAAIAGVRYFGDFERFAAISEVTAEKLDGLHARIGLLLAAPEAEIDYGRVAELAHAADDVVVTEIENWQAVFGGKHIAVPV